jgi:ribosomal protein S12 methylthiotransferase accessory factor
VTAAAHLTALTAASWLAGVPAAARTAGAAGGNGRSRARVRNRVADRGAAPDGGGTTDGDVADGDAAAACVVTLDTRRLETTRHVLTRRPQCRACGDPSLQARLADRPVVPGPRPRSAAVDGGHRAEPPERLLARCADQVSPITGAVWRLVPVRTDVDLVHTYTAGHNFALGVNDLDVLREGLRSFAAGKGMTDVQARASATGEAIERYSGLYLGDERRIRASFQELGGPALHPNGCTLFSAAQYRDRARWNARRHAFSTVGDPFDEQMPIDWTPVWPLDGGEPRYLPTMYLYYHYPKPAGQLYCWADSNGNAAGTSIEDAIVQGALELVERDSAALWWYNRLRRPRVDLDSFADPYIDRWLSTYRSLGRAAWVLDLTADLGIPAVVAVSHRIDKPVEDVLLAFGAHFDARIAVVRALSEMNQFLPAVLPLRADGTGDYAFRDPAQLDWWRTATVAGQPYLAPDDTLPARTYASYPNLASDDLGTDVETIRRLLADRGLRMYVLDQTRPDIGLPVVKVIVPGLRHFWARYAPGRLYDVPVELGWLPRPTPEDRLNPIPMFL